MKYTLVICSLFSTLLGCQQSKDYEVFVDQKDKGIMIFDKDFDACKEYAKLHSKKSEGSQGAGERLMLECNLFSMCMKKNHWVIKN